ncbi:MAG: type II toxin-antitoxin system HigB family toxin [Xenococcaceae cyanobacterium MO_188.B32]|nr:type II toxin-antitoxin system HigB family toxin [Xenococcaceae cyanobacterium MO_188.B32]
MHVVSQSKLKQFWRNHPNSEASLRFWYKLTTQNQWQNLSVLRQIFPSADLVKNFIVFNIGGNNFRLITYIDFQQNKVFIRHILTHAEYNKEDWKKDDWYQ